MASALQYLDNDATQQTRLFIRFLIAFADISPPYYLLNFVWYLDTIVAMCDV